MPVTLPAQSIPVACVLAALALPTPAQQLQHQPGLIPGTPRWSEGVEATDVDNDGDLDLFFADGDGFISGSTKRQNVLVVNQLVETGSLAFTDESLARLGAHESYAKGVTTGDVDGDGWVDALFSNAFDADPAFLYVNKGLSRPGFFRFEGVARGFTTNIAAGGAMFSDVDDDGDLDVVINNNYLGSGSGRPRLYRNDGAGFFTLDAVAFAAAPNKSSHMDVQMVDVDGDFDVDFFGANRSGGGGGNHFLMLNDGDGVFSDASSVLPSTSNNVYEAEAGDLDGDEDIDLFFVSLSGFSEGAMRNNLLPTGTLSFASHSAFGGDDDNEVALFDYDVDGDYDVVVGSLGPRDKLYRNDGGLSFADVSAQITAVSDSTLDCTVADLDNDGRYDLVTAQGESNAPQYANKVYLNVGGLADTLPPVVTGLRSPVNAPKTAPVVVHAKVRDQVLDDGVDHLTASARSVVLTASASTIVTITPTGFSPALSTVTPGTGVTFYNASGATRELSGTTPPYTWSLTLSTGQLYEHVFVAQTDYGIAAEPGGFAGVVTVTGGNVTTTEGLRAGVGQYRFALPNTVGASAVRLAYELELTDWAGNRTVTSNGVVGLVDCGLATYCTSKPSSISQCVPGIQATGTPSASAGSGFVVRAAPVPGNKVGLLVYTTKGAAQVPLQNAFGWLCITTSGLRRIATQTSGGTPGLCDGELSVDFNLYYATQTGDPNLVPGAQVDLQAWYRDPPSPGGANLTDAGRFFMCP